MSAILTPYIEYGSWCVRAMIIFGWASRIASRRESSLFKVPAALMLLLTCTYICSPPFRMTNQIASKNRIASRKDDLYFQNMRVFIVLKLQTQDCSLFVSKGIYFPGSTSVLVGVAGVAATVFAVLTVSKRISTDHSRAHRHTARR